MCEGNEIIQCDIQVYSEATKLRNRKQKHFVLLLESHTLEPMSSGRRFVFVFEKKKSETISLSDQRTSL